MKRYDIQKVYKYFELKKELETLEKEIKNIITKNSDIDICGTWLAGIVEIEKQYDEKRKKYYLYDGRHNAYQQNNYFLWQITEYEDSYFGCIYYPLEDNKYLQINYGC